MQFKLNVCNYLIAFVVPIKHPFSVFIALRIEKGGLIFSPFNLLGGGGVKKKKKRKKEKSQRTI